MVKGKPINKVELEKIVQELKGFAKLSEENPIVTGGVDEVSHRDSFMEDLNYLSKLINQPIMDQIVLYATLRARTFPKLKDCEGFKPGKLYFLKQQKDQSILK